MTWRLWTSRGKGGVFQLAWPIVTPLFLLVIYYYAFGVILHLRGTTGTTPYALEMFCGMAVFNVFSECASAGASAVIGQPGYVRNARFDLEVIPLAVTGCSVISGLIWLTVVIAAAGIGGFLSWSVLWLPGLVVPYLLFCTGIAFFTSAISVYLRDFPQFLALFLQGQFFLTPIIYPMSGIPENCQWLIQLNPLTGFVDAIRSVILHNGVINFHTYGIIYLTGICVFFLGFGFFFKTKKGFADVI